MKNAIIIKETHFKQVQFTLQLYEQYEHKASYDNVKVTEMQSNSGWSEYVTE